MSKLHIEFSRDFSQVEISFENETLTIPTPGYRKTRNFNDKDVGTFDEVNIWLQEQSYEFQKHLFEIYKDLESLTYDTHSVQELGKRAGALIERVVAVTDFETIQKWVTSYKSPIHIPRNQKVDRYLAGTINVRRNTYDFNEYTLLIVYAFILRLTVPILGYILKPYSFEYGNFFKEVKVFDLFKTTWMFDHDVVNRMRDYIEGNFNASLNEDLPMLQYTQDEFLENLLTTSIIKKVALGQLTSKDNSYRLISAVYHHCNNKANDGYANAEGNGKLVRIKKDPTENNLTMDDSNSRSVLETGFIQSKNPPHQIMYLRHCLTDRDLVSKWIIPDTDESTVNLSVNDMMKWDKPIHPIQIHLLSWFIHDVVDSLVLEFLTREELYLVLGYVRAHLWEKGMVEIVKLLSITVDPYSDSFDMTLNMRSNITQENAKKLNDNFPYAGTARGKDFSLSILDLIEEFINNINQNNFIMTLPEEWRQQLGLRGNHPRYQPDADIRNKLVEYINYICER